MSLLQLPSLVRGPVIILQEGEQAGGCGEGECGGGHRFLTSGGGSSWRATGGKAGSSKLSWEHGGRPRVPVSCSPAQCSCLKPMTECVNPRWPQKPEWSLKILKWEPAEGSQEQQTAGGTRPAEVMQTPGRDNKLSHTQQLYLMQFPFPTQRDDAVSLFHTSHSSPFPLSCLPFCFQPFATWVRSVLMLKKSSQHDLLTAKSNGNFSLVTYFCGQWSSIETAEHILSL